MTTTSYLFYSPQLDGMQVPANSVPPMSAGGVHTHPSPVNPPVQPVLGTSELSLTPNYGPSFNRGDPARAGQSQNDVDVSFLNSLPPAGMNPSEANNHHGSQRNHGNHGNHQNFVPYMPVYTSPAYNPIGPSPTVTSQAHYSPMFGTVSPSPMFYGQQQVDNPRGGRTHHSSSQAGTQKNLLNSKFHGSNFDPLPDTSWTDKAVGRKTFPSHRGEFDMYSPMPGYHSDSRGRVAQFSQMNSHAGHSSQFMGHSADFSNMNTSGGKSVILDDLRGVSHTRAHTLQTQKASSVLNGNYVDWQKALEDQEFTLPDIVNEGLVADLATDQNGSRFIQTKLEEASDAEKQAVFEQILPETLRLCTDVFGNYCIQKFFEYGTPEQKQQLSQKIRHRVLPLSLQMYGCRVVQKILESVDAETQNMLIRELDQHVLECVKDQNANHVIQKCIEQVNSSNNIDFIIRAFYGRVFDLSTHPYGCRVIQRMLEHCYPDLKELTEPVLEELMSYAEQLCKNQYGNYVLQHVLQHSTTQAKDKIVDVVSKNILAFSKHKFASNVVERCFVSTDMRQRDVLLNAVIGNSDCSPLVSMVRDQYGNYVIQKMLETLNIPQRNKLIRKIGEYVPNIRKIAFGKHIVAKIEKLTGKVV